MNEDVRALKDALENLNITKEHIKRDSNRYFVQNSEISELNPNLSPRGTPIYE